MTPSNIHFPQTITTDPLYLGGSDYTTLAFRLVKDTLYLYHDSAEAGTTYTVNSNNLYDRNNIECRISRRDSIHAVVGASYLGVSLYDSPLAADEFETMLETYLALRPKRTYFRAGALTVDPLPSNDTMLYVDWDEGGSSPFWASTQGGRLMFSGTQYINYTNAYLSPRSHGGLAVFARVSLKGT